MNSFSLRHTLLMASVLFAFSGRAAALEPLVTNFGLGTMLHPVQEPNAVPAPNDFCKQHVHIFAVNGLNPLCLGNFNGMCTYFKKQGFEHTHFGQLYTSGFFCSQIREIRRTDPDAKIALIGFSWGANYVKAMTNSLAQDGTRIDLLVYLVGDLISNDASSHPNNVARVVNIRAKGLVFTGGDLTFNGANIEGAQNHRLDCRHILAPSRQETLTILMQELTKLGCGPGGTSAPPSNNSVSFKKSR